MLDPDRPAEQFGSPRPSGHRKGQWVAVASLVVAILTLLIALPGAINDWTTLRDPLPTPTDATNSTVATTKPPTSPSNRPSSPTPTKTATATPKPDQGKGSSAFDPASILQRVNTYRANLSIQGFVTVAAAGAVIIFVCAVICRLVIVISYWSIGIPTWIVLIGIPLFVWPSISGYGTTALTVLGVAYAVASAVVAWIAAVVADI